jgi:hypothetical protein
MRALTTEISEERFNRLKRLWLSVWLDTERDSRLMYKVPSPSPDCENAYD